MAIFSKESFENIEKRRKDMGFPGFLLEEAQKSFQYLEQKGLPTKKNERYKYTNLGFLKDVDFVNSTVSGEGQTHASSANTIGFKNGSISIHISDSSGISVFKLSEFSNWPEKTKEFFKVQFSKFTETDEPLEALNSMQFEDGVFIHISGKQSQSLHLMHKNSGDDKQDSYTTASIRNYVLMDSNTSLDLLEEFSTLGRVYRNNTFYAALGKGARLNRASLQGDNMTSLGFFNLRIKLDRDSYLHNQTLALGSKLSRNNVEVDICGENAELDLLGAYVIEGDQHSDHHTTINHHKGYSISRENYKGLLNDQSEAVFNGRVYIAQDAQKTDSSQLNKNLVLTERAEVNTKPELEVFADDVKAAHGATVGQLDPEELFYLESRAIPRAEATKMIAEGFIKEIPMQFPNKEFKNLLLDAATKKLKSFNLEEI